MAAVNSYVCPGDDNKIVSTLYDQERYDFLVLCNTAIADSVDGTTVNLIVSGLSYSTFTECVAACVKADNGFSDVVCQGVSWIERPNGNDCFLKTSAADYTAAPGVDSAVLQRIAIAVDNTTVTGVAFANASAAATATVDTSSSLSAILANSTSSMPIITPAPVMTGNRAGVADSTYYVSGTAYSTNSSYSTYFSSNGS
ncbi:hypothetical protein LTR16_008527, partial [Cryomyces antarcticus]